MKKYLCIILSLCILLGILAIPAAATEGTPLKEANFYVEAPADGAKPSYEVTTDRSDVFTISNVEWKGDFDANGCFIAKNTYRINFVIKVKDGVDITIPSKAGTNARNYRLNGKLLSVGQVLNGGKVFKAGLNMEVALSAAKLDTDTILSKAHADSMNYENIVNLFVVKSRADSYKLNGEQSDPVTRVIVDTSEEVSGAIMEDMMNLTEVWLSPKVDAKAFIESYAAAGPTFQRMFAWTSNGAKTWDFKLYVPVESLPNGLKDLGFYGSRVMWFETVLYSGDVYAAYEKQHSGQNVSIPWCTNHQYTAALTTADRVMSEMDCCGARWYCYSCAICGKPEENANHVFSHDDVNPPNDTRNARSEHKFTYDVSNIIKAEYYLGKNSKGEYVYQKSCQNCGISAHDAYTGADISREYYDIIHAGDEVTYDLFISARKKAWTEVAVPNALTAVVGNDSQYGFAVKEAPVTAKVSAWAENEVNWAKQEGLLDEQLLGSNYKNTITRLQFCSLAVKLAENLLGREIEPAPSGTFKDTDNIYVRKAFAAGITTGTGVGVFSPDATLNRQQMATFVHRALMYVRDNSGIRYTVYDSQLGSYTDSSKIAAWAKEPMAFMNALGLVKGTTATTLAPTANCTIEQAILVAYRSLSANEIGWYQVIRKGSPVQFYLMTLENETTNHHTQCSVENGDRIWVTDFITDGYREWLKTAYPYFPDLEVYIAADGFKPIKDLSTEDLALYNKNNGIK